MSTIIARTYSGARDLYFDLPDLLNATVEEVTHKDNTNKDYETELMLKDTKGNLHRIIIAQGY